MRKGKGEWMDRRKGVIIHKSALILKIFKPSMHYDVLSLHNDKAIMYNDEMKMYKEMLGELSELTAKYSYCQLFMPK